MGSLLRTESITALAAASGIDEIFRKDQSDKENRILLSFQNDRGKSILRPAGDYKESLSFRLYIVGQGNHELKLPLDGKSGRPTLKGGKPHNIAETYNVKTGLEAIFIDGEMLVTYQYPAGSKVLSSGTGGANKYGALQIHQTVIQKHMLG